MQLKQSLQSLLTRAQCQLKRRIDRQLKRGIGRNSPALRFLSTFGRFSTFGLLLAFGTLPVSAAPPPIPVPKPVAINFLDVNGTTAVNLTFGNTTYNNVATGEYHMSVNGSQAISAFCTDLWDEVYVPETWNATIHQTSAADGLATAISRYQMGPYNVNAIDFIGQHYTAASASQQAAAQLAIWDIGLNGRVSKTGVSTYAWSTIFQETSGNVKASDVYTIEQAALGAKGPQGSEWLEAVAGSQSDNRPRPQDFVTSSDLYPTPAPTATPEPSSVAMFGFVGLGLALLLRRAGKRRY